jgi:formylglycine-generating enzyme required for sulfatase activity
MLQSIQHSLRWITPPLGAAVILLALWPGTAPSQGTGKLPDVEPVKHKAFVEKLDEEVSFEMLPIPGGSFLMGSPASEKGRGADEGPQHPVQVKPFWMGKYEVRWDEYDMFWLKRPGGPPPRPDVTKKPDPKSDALTSPTPPYDDPTFGHGKANNPALAITQHAAMEYCRWLSKKTGKTYRLPTEAEWEWACRAGTTTAYSFGDDPKKIGDYAWWEDNSEEHSHKVGEKKPNPWGLYDMHGNVAEWCIDVYRKDFYATLPQDKLSLNPFNPPTENRYPYVARGGSWIDPPEKCRSAARRFSEKSWLRLDPQRPQSIWWMTSADYVGFRVVVAVEEDSRLKGIRSKVNWWSI